MQTITTKWLAPTNYRVSRIKARASGGKEALILSWDYALGSEENHRLAAMALATKLEWDGEWIGGESPDECGHTYVRALSFSPRFTVEATDQTPDAGQVK